MKVARTEKECFLAVFREFPLIRESGRAGKGTLEA